MERDEGLEFVAMGYRKKARQRVFNQSMPQIVNYG